MESHNQTELTLPCGSVVTLTLLNQPFKGFSYRCDGTTKDGIRVVKLGVSQINAIARWKEAVKWERVKTKRYLESSSQARRERGRPQYFNGEKVQ